MHLEKLILKVLRSISGSFFVHGGGRPVFPSPFVEQTVFLHRIAFTPLLTSLFFY